MFNHLPTTGSVRARIAKAGDTADGTHGDLDPKDTYAVDGEIIEVLRGCGIASIQGSGAHIFTVDRGTEGIHFDELRTGLAIHCEVTCRFNRVLRAQVLAIPPPDCKNQPDCVYRRGN